MPPPRGSLAASPRSSRHMRRAGCPERSGRPGSIGGRGRRRRWTGRRRPRPQRQKSRALSYHFAEEALRKEEEEEEKAEDGEYVWVRGAAATAGEQRHVRGGEGLQEPEHDAAQHSAGNVADATEHGRREGLQARNEARVGVDEAVLHSEQHAGGTTHCATDQERQRDDPVDVDAHEAGRRLILGDPANRRADLPPVYRAMPPP